MKKGMWHLFLALFLFLPPFAAAEEVSLVARPETKTFLELSNKDINRLVCDSAVSDVVYPEDKGLSVRYVQESAYVRFAYLKNAKETEYSSEPAGIHVVCGGETFSLVLIPKPITPQTVYLKGKGRAEANASAFGGMPFEEKLKKAALMLYREKLPAGIGIKMVGISVPVYKDLDVVYVRRLRIGGEGICIKEYTVKNISSSSMELEERQFLRDEFEEEPLAAMIDPLILQPDAAGKVYIFDRCGGEDVR